MILIGVLFGCEKATEEGAEESAAYTYFKQSQIDSLSIVKRKALLDEALSLLEGNDKDSLYKKMLYKKMHLYFREKQYDSVLLLSDVMLSEKFRSDEVYYQGNTLFFKAICYHNLNQVDSAYSNYEKSKEVFLRVNDSVSVGRRLLNMAIIECDHDDFSQSDYSATQALRYLGEKGKAFVPSVYNTLAISARHQKQYKEALGYYEKAIEITESARSKLLYNNNMANVYRDIGDYKKSIALSEKVAKDSLLNTYPLSFKTKVLHNLAYSNWLLTREDRYLNEMLSILQTRIAMDDQFGLISSYSRLADVYKEKNSKKSSYYAHKMYSMTLRCNSPKEGLKALSKIIDLSASKATKAYYQSYITLNDSLQQASERAKHRFAKIRYHSEQHKKEALLFKAKSYEKELQVEKEKHRRNYIIAFALIVFAVVVFYYYYRIQNEKKAKIFEVYKTEKRISEKIHDELSNDVFSLMNSIQYSGASSEELLDGLDKIYKQTRNISHENSAVALGVEFDHSLKQMLSSFMNPSCRVMLKDMDKAELKGLDYTKQIVLYRVLQELLVNMKKHSRASLVVISFQQEKEKLHINYADNGIGCDLKQLKSKNGLVNMETRIHSIGGSITFDVKPDKGFKAAIHFKR